jgi:DHA1 family tetracycline resistance protein-like MFS transporter
MVYVVSLSAFLFALTYPSMNALASQQTPANAQGELQGAVACLYSLSSIVGPPLMTQVFSYFTARTAPVFFPGAAFLAAAALTIVCALLFMKAARAAPAAAAAHIAIIPPEV